MIVVFCVCLVHIVLARTESVSDFLAQSWPRCCNDQRIAQLISIVSVDFPFGFQEPLQRSLRACFFGTMLFFPTCMPTRWTPVVRCYQLLLRPFGIDLDIPPWNHSYWSCYRFPFHHTKATLPLTWTKHHNSAPRTVYCSCNGGAVSQYFCCWCESWFRHIWEDLPYPYKL